MSYILEALRKSEQQRQAIKPENLTERILLNQIASQKKRFPWMMTLILINVLLLTVAGWFYFQAKVNSHYVTTSVAVSADKAIEHPIKLLPVPPQPLQLQTNNADRAMSNSIRSTIEEMVAAKNQESKFTPHITKVEKKPVQNIKNNANPQTTTSIKRVKASSENREPPPNLILKKGILRVDELSPVIRNNLPNLNINVFSYAYAPDERFVIIDMVKYHIGQRINGSVMLKNIFPDHIVLEYEDILFRKERP